MTALLPPDDSRIADLCALMELMPRLVAPAVAPLAAPDLDVLADPAGLARAAAASSVRIVDAVAALGEGDDAAHAQVLWTETLAQIARIQKLYGLPALPFQSVARLDELPTNLPLASLPFFPSADEPEPAS